MGLLEAGFWNKLIQLLGIVSCPVREGINTEDAIIF